MFSLEVNSVISLYLNMITILGSMVNIMFGGGSMTIQQAQESSLQLFVNLHKMRWKNGKQ